MRTISTKLDPKLHNQFMEICNREGKCQSEFLRDLIESVCDDLGYEEEPSQDLEIEHTPEPTELREPKVEIIYD